MDVLQPLHAGPLSGLPVGQDAFGSAGVQLCGVKCIGSCLCVALAAATSVGLGGGLAAAGAWLIAASLHRHIGIDDAPGCEPRTAIMRCSIQVCSVLLMFCIAEVNTNKTRNTLLPAQHMLSMIRIQGI